MTWNYLSFDPAAARRRERDPEVAALPRPEVVKLLASGFDMALADLYWIGGVHYFGDATNEKVCFGQLANYLELVVALDPDFESAYRLGALGIPCRDKDGWHHLTEAAKLSEKGVAQFPKNWFFKMLYAQVLIEGREQFGGNAAMLRAAELVKQAAEVPGSPRFLPGLATRLAVTAGDVDHATEMAEALLASTPDEETRAVIEKRLRQLQVLSELSRLNSAIEQFKERSGRAPRDLQELAEAHFIPVTPEDPLGGRFEIDPATGKARSTALTDQLTLFIPDEK